MLQIDSTREQLRLVTEAITTLEQIDNPGPSIATTILSLLRDREMLRAAVGVMSLKETTCKVTS